MSAEPFCLHCKAGLPLFPQPCSPVPLSAGFFLDFVWGLDVHSEHTVSRCWAWRSNMKKKKQGRLCEKTPATLKTALFSEADVLELLPVLSDRMKGN